MSNNKTIAIIGIGPRGLAALEALYIAKQEKALKTKLNVLLFEEAAYPGAGKIWSPQQVVTNLSNISERHLSAGLQGRPEIRFDNLYIASFPGYQEWITTDADEIKTAAVDYFPPRAKLGAYLNARFESIKNALLGVDCATLIANKVTHVETTQTGCLITDETHKKYHTDEVVLTIGHQATQLSDQLKAWEKHTKEFSHLKLYKDPYPVGALETETITPDAVVALRGFGLSMVDQVRALTLGFGGTFTNSENGLKFKYHPSATAPKKLIVFSLDGLPPAPKPVNSAIDSWFEPTVDEITHFRDELDSALKKPELIIDATFLIKALATLTASVFKRLAHKARYYSSDETYLESLVETIIRKPETRHSLVLDKNLPALDQMEMLLEMAFGKQKISLDYCLGQVWRYALGILYHDYTHLDISDVAMIDIVSYIEASKRYSYGPPVASLQQLIAVAEAGVLDLNFVENPEIKLTPQGWQLFKNGKVSTANVMVNSVIDPPQLIAVNSPVVQHLLDDHKVDAVSYKLGLHTLQDGRIISSAGNSNQHIALLGRLAKGSVIGVDDLIECFGKPARKWAEGVLNRTAKKEN
ncbi:MAG: FAD/NAD(P)-binding protein [Leeuwenhoekiella sp.]|nr:FAD/NAD(P)-binding protein [Leeuwenhoekiella sp.]